MGKPFFAYPGGKSRILGLIRRYYPATITKYVEPFIGGGSVFFDIAERFPECECYLSDKNYDLINLYNAVREEGELFSKTIEEVNYKYSHSDDKKAFYYDLRDNYITPCEYDFERAIEFFTINQLGFHKKIRYNRQGRINTSWGAKPRILYRKQQILDDIECLKRAHICCCDFDETIKHVDPGTFVYIDPPYVRADDIVSSGYVNYTKFGFDVHEQKRVVEYIHKLNAIDAIFVLSNSDTQCTREWYKDFHVEPIIAPQQGNPCHRSNKELLVSNTMPREGLFDGNLILH